MNDFKIQLKEKTNEELLKILICSQDYQPEFVELAKKEFIEVRNQSYEDFIGNTTDEELSNYYILLTNYQTDEHFTGLVKKELIENRHISLESLQAKQKLKQKETSKEKKKIAWRIFFLFAIGITGIMSIFLLNHIGLEHWILDVLDPIFEFMEGNLVVFNIIILYGIPCLIGFGGLFLSFNKNKRTNYIGQLLTIVSAVMCFILAYYAFINAIIFTSICGFVIAGSIVFYWLFKENIDIKKKDKKSDKK